MEASALREELTSRSETHQLLVLWTPKNWLLNEFSMFDQAEVRDWLTGNPLSRILNEPMERVDLPSSPFVF
ncbi:MAG: hypothetical protein O3C28_01400 [Proteobacteria bacterium]|nr:hypothetical protein [Pseudomonadota bacterium]